MSTSRRNWIKQASLTLAALGTGTAAFEAAALPSYRPADGPILLNSNENAFGPSPQVVRAMAAAAAGSNRYPDNEIPKLLAKLAAHHNVNKENILMGAGSSEILLQVAMLAGRQKGNAVTAEPSFNSWVKLAQEMGLNVIRVPVNAERKLDLEKMKAAVTAETRLVYVCNPNNPVGNYVDLTKLLTFVDECSRRSLVLVDEAYTEFADIPSLAPIAVTNRNVIVAKTFSKIYGLAGARIGYAIAHPETIQRLATFQAWPHVSISQVTAAAASAALDDQAFVRYCALKTAEAREKVYQTLKDLKLSYIPSSTSFLMFNIDPIKCNYEEAMNKKNIMVQHRNHFGGKWCRVSMGTLNEMDIFCQALREICA